MKWFTYLIRSLAFMLFAAFGVSTALAVPMEASEINCAQTETIHIAQTNDVCFAVRAPPMAVTNIAFAGVAVAEQGNGIIMHGYETHVASLGFRVGFVAPNTIPERIVIGTNTAGDSVVSIQGREMSIHASGQATTRGISNDSIANAMD